MTGLLITAGALFIIPVVFFIAALVNATRSNNGRDTGPR